jgi:hypothetical protein
MGDTATQTGALWPCGNTLGRYVPIRAFTSGTLDGRVYVNRSAHRSVDVNRSAPP